MNARTIILLCAVLATAEGCRKSPQVAYPVAATNSTLECAARDLLGDATPVLRLAEPGTFPGHFDVRPGQVQQLRRCRVLLRLDFQSALDAKLAGPREDGLRIAAVRVEGGLCEPNSYLAACRQTADALVAAGLLDPNAADARLVEITDRVHRTAERCRAKLGRCAAVPVVASAHQEAFCRWLGLDVAAVFSGADTAGVAQIDQAVRRGEAAGARIVIANRPEGRRVADALADRLGAKVVVFGNFPALGEGQSSFDDLLEANVAALMEAVPQ